MRRNPVSETEYNDVTHPRLTFRNAAESDIPALAALSYHAFPISSLPIRSRDDALRDRPIFPLDWRLVGETGGEDDPAAAKVPGRIVTTMTSIQYAAWVGGRRHATLGVAGVAVAPDARRRGHARAIMIEGMRRARAAGATLSALYPFRHDFYASLGYATAVERRAWTFDPRDLPVYPEHERVRLAGAGDLERVMASYDRVMRRSTLMVERSADYWRRRVLADGRSFLAFYEDGTGEPRGYLVFSYEEYEDGRLTELHVQELVAEHEEAFRGLLGHLAALRDQFREISCVLPPEERLDLRLRNPRDRGAVMGPGSEHYGPRVLYGAMARVLDVAALIEGREGDGRVRLEISDPQLPENDGAFDLAVEDVGRAGPARMGIGPFSQLALGYATATELRRAGHLEADDAATAALDRAFADPAPAMLDYF